MNETGVLKMPFLYLPALPSPKNFEFFLPSFFCPSAWGKCVRSGPRKELLGPWAGLAAAGGEERGGGGGGGGGGKSNDACNYSASHDTVLGGRRRRRRDKKSRFSLSLGRLTRFDRSGGDYLEFSYYGDFFEVGGGICNGFLCPSPRVAKYSLVSGQRGF